MCLRRDRAYFVNRMAALWVVAADGATVVPAVVNIRAVPAAGGTYCIARLLGPALGFEWMSSGRGLTAADGHAWGLVSEVVEADELGSRAAGLAAELAALRTK